MQDFGSLKLWWPSWAHPCSFLGRSCPKMVSKMEIKVVRKVIKNWFKKVIKNLSKKNSVGPQNGLQKGDKNKRFTLAFLIGAFSKKN